IPLEPPVIFCQSDVNRRAQYQTACRRSVWETEDSLEEELERTTQVLVDRTVTPVRPGVHQSQSSEGALGFAVSTGVVAGQFAGVVNYPSVPFLAGGVWSYDSWGESTSVQPFKKSCGQ